MNQGAIGSDFKTQPAYKAYRSPYGPKYTVKPNIRGWTVGGATKLGLTLASFGGVAGVFAIFFFSDVPKVRNDIMIKIPLIGNHFVREIPPSDNPF
ncbi:ubiquinol-cytochrome-c reductase complex subunit-domain-containing protein [Tricladium varicosporioides]|nr:ubiquinol-cytochrome-c reductase complex subunit-domain-containing protein [Hymenoscyphus varicosporioides]